MRCSPFVIAGKMLATLFAAAEATTIAKTFAAAIATTAYMSSTTIAAITSHNNHHHHHNNNNNNNYYYNNNNNNNLNTNTNNNNHNNINNNSAVAAAAAAAVTFIVTTMNENYTISTLTPTTAMNNTATATATTTTLTTLTTLTTTTTTALGAIGIGTKINDHNLLLTADGGDTDPAAYVPPSQRPETYVVTALFTLIFIVGVLGNGTLVIIFFRHRSMRNIPNTYILSLALADLLVIVVCVPMATIVYTQESWTFGVNLCRVSEFFKDISIGVSVFTLTALSGERYFAIVNPLRKLQTKPLTVFTATMIWLLAIFLGTPSFIISDVDEIHIVTNEYNFTIRVCTPFGKNGTNTETYAKYTVISKACIYYLLPLSIIGALYILMAKRLHTSAREMPGEALGMQSRSQARARRHVARMVVAFVVVFFACFFPYHVFELWYHLNPTSREDFDEFWHAVRIIGFCTSFLHSCVNPVTLYCISGVFRQHFNRYLCCLCVKKQPRLRQHSTATAMMDTSIVSIRRTNTTVHHNYNRASLYINNSTLGPGTGNSTSTVGFHRQPSLQIQRGNLCANNNKGTTNGGGGGGGGGNGDSGNGLNSSNTGGTRNIVGNANKGAISPAQSIILNDKR